MKRVLPTVAVFLVAAGLLGVLLFTQWPDPAAGLERPAVPRVAAERAPAAQYGETQTPRPVPGANTTADSAERENLPGQSSDPALAVFRGRCVDHQGAPVAGVRVKLHGWVGNSRRLDAYRKTHGEVQWSDPEPLDTGADGRFEIAAVPPPPYQFTLDLGREGLLELTGRWHEIPPGTVKDFGDIEMRPGCRVLGRVEDSTGQPLTKGRINVDQFNTPGRLPDEKIQPRTYLSCPVRSDGSYEFARLLPPGTYSLQIRGEQILSPDNLVVPEDLPTHPVTIVVKSQADIPTISGRLVDAAGDPVARARIDLEPRREGRGFIITTGRDGTFTVRRGDRDTGSAVRLVFQRDGFETLDSKESYPWGTKDLRFVMRRGLDVRVHVTDAATGLPVEDYAVIALPQPGHWRTRPVRGRGQGFRQG